MSRWTFRTATILTVLVYVQTCIAQNFSAFFIFGDSLADVGNNNYITTISKADYEPVGIDFGKPTGRFTNGRTVDDMLGQALGFKSFPPPYLAPTTVGPVVLKGVNYASGSSGILDASGANYIGRISMNKQLENFEKTRMEIISSIGGPAAETLLATSLFAVTTGSNDFINNYLLPHLLKKEPQEKFIRRMISTYRKQLTRLYYRGARMIMVANVPPIGCCPNQRDLNPSSGQECAEFPNLLARQFNQRLKRMVKELTVTLEGSRFIYADVYHIFHDIVQNYKLYGFEIADKACCSMLGIHGGLLPCLQQSNVCPDRSKYIFWDWFHVTESAYAIIAKRLFDGEPDDISPTNIRMLSETSNMI
ncbi:GDSL esterase/lipase At4g16230-like [Rutidosis leptorrhynchoides]|uniref:GDSL esterase/lipase At4g16230-like n=1 Tax=Rutidosis leptorrhynchoides TaxID=125765 RepID=UPI003A98F6B8